MGYVSFREGIYFTISLPAVSVFLIRGSRNGVEVVESSDQPNGVNRIEVVGFYEENPLTKRQATEISYC